MAGSLSTSLCLDILARLFFDAFPAYWAYQYAGILSYFDFCWVILAQMLELFCRKCLSYFSTGILSNFGQNTWVFWVRTLSKTCKMQKYPQINQKFARNSNVLSYIPNHLPKICRPLELFPPSAWVIFKTLSYFAWEILELFSKRRKKSLI